MDESPTWRREFGHHALEWRGCEIARVAPTVQGDRWLVRLGLHRRDYRRHHTVYRATQEAACSTCLAWWAQHAAAIAAELPRMVPGPVHLLDQAVPRRARVALELATLVLGERCIRLPIARRLNPSSRSACA